LATTTKPGTSGSERSSVKTRATVPGFSSRWFLLGVLTLFSTFGAATVWWGFTAYYDPLIEEFGWSHTEVSFSAALQATESGLGAIFAGLLFQRLGARKIVIGGALLMTFGFLLLSRVSNLPTFYLSYVLLGLGVTTSGSAVMLPIISRRFQDRVALSFGLFSVSGGAGGFALPFIAKLLDSIGFRKTFVIFALVAFVLGLGVATVLQDAKQPSWPAPGEKALSARNTRSSSLEKPRFREMLRSRVLWVLIAFFVAHFIALQMLTAHVMPFLESIGYGRGTAARMAMAVPALSLVGRIGFGWIGERFNHLYVIAGAVFLSAVALGGLAITAPGMAVMFFLGLFAVSHGLLVPGRATILADYFEASYFAAMLGFMVGIGSFAGMLGPVGGGWLYDLTGTYRTPLLISSAALLVAASLLISSSQLRDRLSMQEK